MRTWFESRNRREQLLVTVFVLMAAIAWLFTATKHVRGRWTDWQSTRISVGEQQLWLDRQKELEAGATSAVRNLDPAKTIDAARLVATVTSLASGAGLPTPGIDPPTTQRTPQFAYHTVKVTFRRTTLAALLSFYDELSKQSPYLSLEQIALQTDRGGPGMLSATMQISATQITK